MTALMDRLSRWLYNKLVGIKPLENLDTPKCAVCGTPLNEAGYHDYGVWVEQP